MLVAELIKPEGTVNFHKNFLSHRSVNRFLRASYLNVISTYGSMRLSFRRAPSLVGVSHCSTYKDEETLMRWEYLVMARLALDAIFNKISREPVYMGRIRS